MKNSRKKWLLAFLICILAAFFCMLLLRGRREAEIKKFTAFIAVPGDRISQESRLSQKIAEKTGAYAAVEWLTGQTAAEKIDSMITTGEYPDFIHGSSATSELVEAGAFIPLDDYLKDYPNLYGNVTEQQWDSFRKEDGHIYYIPVFGIIKGHSTETIRSDEAFWVQKRVLEWADYPKLKTLDEYFDLIAAYQKANPLTEGASTIGFEILCDDWRYFCLENPPMFLAGYPNDGCAIVDPQTQKASVYDTIPEAKQYYQKLCEMYNKGVVDPETFTLSFQQYLDRIATGRALGFVDQYWQIMTVQNELYAEGKEEYTYVPFAITANAEIKGRYSCAASDNLNVAEGLGVSVNCKDVEGALQFLDDLLTPEIMTLRNWGEAGVDYEIDANGVFYRTKEQRKNWSDSDFLKETRCDYYFFPGYEGMMPDGLNTVLPAEQPGEYYETLSEYDQKILNAYGARTWKELMGEEEESALWYPLYSCTGDWGSDTDYGQAKENMDRVKRMWLPKVIMSAEEDFEKNWEAYMQTYQTQVDVSAYENELNQEIQRRIAAAKGDGSGS